MLKTSSVPTLQLIIKGLKRCGRKRTCLPLHEYTQEKRRFAKICKQILVNDMLICPRSQVKWGQGAFLSSTFTQIPTFPLSERHSTFSTRSNITTPTFTLIPRHIFSCIYVSHPSHCERNTISFVFCHMQICTTPVVIIFTNIIITSIIIIAIFITNVVV